MADRGIDDLGGHEFEDLVEALLQKMGLVTEGRKPSADGGVDIVANNPAPVVGGRYIVQCKRYSHPVGVPVVRDLFGVVTAERAGKGILVTTSRFTQDAIEFAADKPLELIDGDRLAALLRGHDVSAAVRLAGNLQTFAKDLVPGVRKVFDRFSDVDRRMAVVRPRAFPGKNGLNVYRRWRAKHEKTVMALQAALVNVIASSLPLYVLSDEARPEWARRDASRIAATLGELEKEWEEFLGAEAPLFTRSRHTHIRDGCRAWLSAGFQFAQGIDEAAKGRRSLTSDYFAAWRTRQ